MNYDDYMNSARWRERREAYFEVRSRRCRANGCYSREAIELHHRTYARLGHERDDDLVALCAKCHKKVHVAEARMREGNPALTRSAAILQATVDLHISSDSVKERGPMRLYTGADGTLVMDDRPVKQRDVYSLLRRRTSLKRLDVDALPRRLA